MTVTTQRAMPNEGWRLEKKRESAGLNFIDHGFSQTEGA